MTENERFVVIDLGGTRARVAVGSADGRLLERLDERTKLEEGSQGVIHQLARMARDVAEASGTSVSDIERLVIGAPGPLDPRTGVVRDAPNMTGWHEVHLRDDLEQILGVPVTAVNDANAAAVGEHVFGAGQGHLNVVYLTISTGIGGGVIVDGRLVEGASGTAGEIGHMTIDRHGPVCACGNVGCLEALASGTAIGRRFRQRLAEGERSSVTVPEPTGADVTRAAADGDPLASAVLRDAAEALGFGLVNCVHIFNPDLIILGGGVTGAGTLLFEPVEEIVRTHAMAVPRDAVRIVEAKLGDSAGLYGALALAMGSG